MIPTHISDKLANLSFIATCLVVTIHIPTGGVFAGLFSSGIAQTMVPIFFLISGIFASDSITRHGIKRVYKKKVLSLFIPYVFLNLIVYIMACMELSCGKEWSFSPKMTEVSLRTLLLSLGIAKTRYCFLYPLWYVRCLMFFFLISPVLQFFINRGLVWIITMIVALGLFDCFIFLLQLHDVFFVLFSYWFNFTGLLFFAVGMVIGSSYSKLDKECILGRIPMGSVCVKLLWGAVLGLCMIGCNYFAHNGSSILNQCLMHYVILPLAPVCFYILMPIKRFSKILLRNTFGIFVIHTIVIHYIQFFDPPIESDIRRCIYWIGVVVCSVFISEFMHRMLPKMTNVLLGGR